MGSVGKDYMVMKNECKNCKQLEKLVFVLFMMALAFSIIGYWLGRGDCGL